MDNVILPQVIKSKTAHIIFRMSRKEHTRIKAKAARKGVSVQRVGNVLFSKWANGEVDLL